MGKLLVGRAFASNAVAEFRDPLLRGAVGTAEDRALPLHTVADHLAPAVLEAGARA